MLLNGVVESVVYHQKIGVLTRLGAHGKLTVDEDGYVVVTLRIADGSDQQPDYRELYEVLCTS